MKKLGLLLTLVASTAFADFSSKPLSTAIGGVGRTDISSAEFGYLGGLTAAIQPQMNLKASIAELLGVSSSIQTQVTALQGVTAGTSAQITALQGATTSLQTQINTNGASISALQGLTSGVAGAIAALQTATSTQATQITALQGATSSIQASVAALQGVTLNTWLKLAGGTMSGRLNVEDTISSVTQEINSIASDGGISARKGLWSGTTGSGTGGALRLRRDTGVEGWRISLPGSAGGTDLNIRDVQNAVNIIQVTTSRQVQFPTSGTRLVFEQDGGNTSLETVTLSGLSTFVSNTTITANSYPFIQTVGTTNASPWLIGVSSGVGYSVGSGSALGSTAKVFILEGQ